MSKPGDPDLSKKLHNDDGVSSDVKSTEAHANHSSPIVDDAETPTTKSSAAETSLEIVLGEEDTEKEVSDVSINESSEKVEQKFLANAELARSDEHATPQSENDSDTRWAESDDVTSKAAVALAAVAAAAMANNNSPAEAAREARAVAQSFISNDNVEEMTTIPDGTFTFVDLAMVKKLLLRNDINTSSSDLTLRLGKGENDYILSFILLFEFFRVSGPDQEGTSHCEDEVVATEACHKVTSFIRKAEAAYDSLVDLLPVNQLDNPLESNGTPDSSSFLCDLLPPCSVPGGDPTEAFFRVCQGDKLSNSQAHDNDSTVDVLDEPRDGSKVQASSPQTSSERQGSVLNYFRRNPAGTKAFGGMFRKKSQRGSFPVKETTNLGEMSSETTERSSEYIVTIEREMLGLTVENVLERTLVRTVLVGGPAKKAGATVGSLIVRVGNAETQNLTHFETIDELRQSQRPLQLVLRQIDDESIRKAREEMGKLIQGAGFGVKVDSILKGTQSVPVDQNARPLIAADLRIDAYTKILRRRFSFFTPPNNSNNSKRNDTALCRVGEALVWLLTLFAIGLERHGRQTEMERQEDSTIPDSHDDSQGQHSHAAKDYADAAKSVSKLLLDFFLTKVDNSNTKVQRENASDHQVIKQPVSTAQAGSASRYLSQNRTKNNRRQVLKQPLVSNPELNQAKPILQIGDLLQRARSFLADTNSPPAALVRGEVISLLCTILDLDTDMDLAEEESSSAGVRNRSMTGGVGDLGCAGGLMKLIVLNCPNMRTPGCGTLSSRVPAVTEEDIRVELMRRFGPKDHFSVLDVHSLHAGNRFLAVVHRLAASRSVSSRITACSLAPLIWGHLDFPHQLQLRGVLTRALHDVEVIVRKATATVLHEIAEIVFDPRSVPWLVLMCERAMTDPEPQLRCAAMTLTWHLAENLPNAFSGDPRQGSRYLRRLPSRNDPIFADVYLLQCKLLPVATRLAEDRSPSVRLSVAAQCDRLCDALGDHWSSVVIDVLLALLSDSDECVRCEAVCCVPRLAEIVLSSALAGQMASSEISVLEALIPASMKLQNDKDSSVRVALASAAGDLLTLFVGMQARVYESNSSSAMTILDERNDRLSLHESSAKYKRLVDDRLIPLVQLLLNDNDPEVTSSALRAVTNATRNSVQKSRVRQMSVASEDDTMSISSYHSQASRDKPVFLPVLSEAQVIRLLPTLADLAGSRQWRVRQSAVEIVPALLGCTHKLETRLMISEFCVGLLNDRVDAVRRAAGECLCLGGGSLGSHGSDDSAEWVLSVVIPTVRACSTHVQSKQRLLCLKMIEKLFLDVDLPSSSKVGGINAMTPLSTHSPSKELISIALLLADDRIANVRLSVGRTFECVAHCLEKEDLLVVLEAIKGQKEQEKKNQGGGDRDVLYFAERCLKRVESLLRNP